MNGKLWLLAALATVALISAGCGSSGPSGTGTASSTGTTDGTGSTGTGKNATGQDKAAVKFAEYGLLAPAVPLLLRSARDLLLPVWSLALWSATATAVGVAQFFGAQIFLSGTVGRRQASFLSSADFAALSTAALLVAVVAVARPVVPRLRLAPAIAGVSGALGLIVAGAVASLLGLATALVVLGVVLVARRDLVLPRIAVIGVVAAVVAAGVLALRGSDLNAFARPQDGPDDYLRALRLVDSGKPTC